MLTKEQIKHSKWYRQSGAGIPLIGGLVHMGVPRMHEYSGFRMPLVGLIIKTGDAFSFYNYLDYALVEKEADSILHKVDGDKNWFRGLYSQLSETAFTAEAVGRRMLEERVGSPEFKADYELFIRTAVKGWGSSLFLDILDPFEKKIFSFIFGDRADSLKPRDLTVLTMPDELSYVQRQQKDLLAIYKVAAKDGLKAVDRLVHEHAVKYHWLKNDFERVEYLGVEHYMVQLETMLADPGMIKDIETGLARFDEAQKEKAALLSKLGLGDAIKGKLDFFNWMASFRDERKRLAQITNYYMYGAGEKVATAMGLDMSWMQYALPMELLPLLCGDEKVKSAIQIRQDIGVLFHVNENDHQEIISGPSIREYYEALEQRVASSEIRGSSASLGKAIGPVRVILNQADFDKFMPGDVLVASMTRPEYVPIMKKAAAVITDEGGLTCHAAIVSRELGVPCIIGTQVATKILKDGDMVEVDANHSRIIKL
ncbi:MAG TPA: PEP-utilizing enzyme [bacterium]|nr:MAG: Phosphoenolpyruvate synthase [Parcubacteria group bacterium ADurb.Bin192]HPN15033.1 PEP-utilizing enzyme [bacterium]